MIVNILYTINFIILGVISGCVDKSKIPNQNKKEDTVLYTPSKDTILNKDDIFLAFINLTQDEYLIEWGNASFHNISKDTIHTLPSGKLTLSWYSENAICLRQGCGTSCFYSYILPLQANKKEKYYMYPLAFDKQNNLIAYNGEDTSNLIIVENYLSGNRKLIKEDFLPAPYAGYNIDSIAFLPDKKIFLKWKKKNSTEATKIFNISDVY